MTLPPSFWEKFPNSTIFLTDPLGKLKGELHKMYLAAQGTLLYLTVPGAAQCPIKVLPEKISPLALILHGCKYQMLLQLSCIWAFLLQSYKWVGWMDGLGYDELDGNLCRHLLYDS